MALSVPGSALKSLGVLLLSAESTLAFVKTHTRHADLDPVGGRQQLRAHDWSPVAQQDGMPQVEAERSYVFLTHHKTGTNLMQQLCNLTARLVTGDRDQCAYCWRVRLPAHNDSRPSCVPNNQPAHGPLRGTFSRFTLVSSINPMEFELIRRYAPDFRAVHMIRDPSKMALSAYAYNMFLASAEGAKWRWDTSAEFTQRQRLKDKLREEAQHILPVVWEMQSVDAMAASDNRVLSLDIESFDADFIGSARRLFNHMFDNPPQDQLTKLLAWSLSHSKAQDRHAMAVVASKNYKKEAASAWKEMQAHRQRDVVKVTDFAEPLGYGSNWTRFAHPA